MRRGFYAEQFNRQLHGGTVQLDRVNSVYILYDLDKGWTKAVEFGRSWLKYGQK